MRPLSLLWTLVETPESTIGIEADVNIEAARRALVESKLLRRASSAQSVSCDSCGVEHLEEVQYRERRGLPQAFISCPSDGTVAVLPERLLRWGPDLTALAEALAVSLEATGACTELVAERFWHLGRMTLGSGMTDLFFLRGAGWDDGRAIWHNSERFELALDRILLIPRRLAQESSGLDLGDSVFLEECTELKRGSIHVDRSSLRRSPRLTTSTQVRSIRVPRGKAWKDIRMLLGKDSLTVTVGGVRARRSLKDAGFVRASKGGGPNASWEVLSTFAERGFIPSPVESKKARVLAERILRLRKALIALVPIDGEPIPFDKDEKRYRLGFSCRTSLVADLALPDLSDWKELTVSIERRHLLIQVDRQDASEASDRCSLKALGLEGRNDEPNEAGRRLAELISSRGRVACSDRDKGMLDLGNIFSNAFGLEDPALDFVRSTSVWTTRFGVSGRPGR